MAASTTIAIPCSIRVLWMDRCAGFAGGSWSFMHYASGRNVRCFDYREELYRVTTLLTWTVARALPPAERDVIVDSGGRQIDHHHACLRVALEVRCVLERGGDDSCRQSEFGVVGERERLVVVP